MDNKDFLIDELVHNEQAEWEADRAESDYLLLIDEYFCEQE